MSPVWPAISDEMAASLPSAPEAPGWRHHTVMRSAATENIGARAATAASQRSCSERPCSEAMMDSCVETCTSCESRRTSVAAPDWISKACSVVAAAFAVAPSSRAGSSTLPVEEHAHPIVQPAGEEINLLEDDQRGPSVLYTSGVRPSPQEQYIMGLGHDEGVMCGAPGVDTSALHLRRQANCVGKRRSVVSKERPGACTASAANSAREIMKVGLLGITGGVGQRFAKLALDRGHTVVAMARTPAKVTLKHPCLIVIKGDSTSLEAVSDFAAGEAGGQPAAANLHA